jgi:uncharacterized protein
MIQFNLLAWAARRTVWWRLVVFMGVLLLLWAPLALLLIGLGHYWEQADLAEIGMLAGLYVLFVLWLRQWGRGIYGWPSPLRAYGLAGGWRFGVGAIATFGLGCGSIFGLFALESLLGWAAWQQRDPEFGRILLEGLLMATLVGFAEELLFRGWLLAELERDYGSKAAMVLNGVIFAVAHFIRPWDDIIRTFPQFIGLFILGVALVFARRAGSLALPIGLHAGLVWGYYLIRIGDLAQETGRVPVWVTGIDENPLAGLLGLGVLSILAFCFARHAQPKTFGQAKGF